MGAAAFRKVEAQIRKCIGQHATRERLELQIISTIVASGRVKAVRLQPEKLMQSPLGKCLLGVARRVKYPAHADSEIDFKQPLRLATGG